MSTALDARTVAAHWPYVRRQLSLDRKTAMDRALNLLATDQTAAGGAPVPLGRQALQGRGLTPGEAGNVWRALKELQGRRVVICYEGAGRRPHAWAFQPDMSQWRAMPWRLSARDAEKAILGCICRAVLVFAARFPGQSIGHIENSGEFQLLDERATPRPALFVVDSRGNEESRAAMKNSHAYEPVDSRGKIDPTDAPLLFPEQLRTAPSYSSEEEEVVEILVKGAEAAGGRIFGRPLDELRLVAKRLTTHQAHLIAYKLSRMATPPRGVEIPGLVADCSTHRDVKMAGRSMAPSDSNLAL